MFCDNCGAEVEDEKKFCDNCGATVGKTKPSDFLELANKSDKDDSLPYQPTDPFTRKNPLQAVFLTLIIFPGVGQIYAGKTSRGKFLFLGAVVQAFVAVYISIVEVWKLSYILYSILGIYVLAINIDAVLLVRRYNEFLDKNLRAPEENEKW